MTIHFSLYGKPHQSLSFAEIVKLQQETSELWAHAENSGSEGCYCEVARWNEVAKRYERFAFAKLFGGEHPQDPDEKAPECAARYADSINSHTWQNLPIVHRMPAYESPAQHYTRPLEIPTTKQEGLGNAVQMIINAIEAGNSREALLQAVNLLDDVSSKSNPYRIGKAPKRKERPVYHGTANID